MYLQFAATGITQQSNYDTYLSAFELNVRLAAGAPYISVLNALELGGPSCTPDPTVQVWPYPKTNRSSLG